MSESDDGDGQVRRRMFLGLATIGSALVACRQAAPTPAAATPSTTLRVASVPTAVEGGILPSLLAEYEASSGTKVDLTVGTEAIYDLARAGKCDLVVSHFGHKQAAAFVMDGLGEWPCTVFSNQAALLGPPGDPAKVRDLPDLVEAFSRIARARAPFVANDIDGVHYVTEILWNAAGRPDRTGWFLEPKQKGEEALELAATKGAYMLWGLTPFFRQQQAKLRPLEPLVVADPLLQRMMVTIVVRPERTAGVNAAGARALQAYLLEPATQARMRTIHYPGAEHALWSPAGRNNRSAVLPRG